MLALNFKKGMAQLNGSHSMLFSLVYFCSFSLLVILSSVPTHLEDLLLFCSFFWSLSSLFCTVFVSWLLKVSDFGSLLCLLELVLSVAVLLYDWNWIGIRSWVGAKLHVPASWPFQLIGHGYFVPVLVLLQDRGWNSDWITLRDIDCIVYGTCKSSAFAHAYWYVAAKSSNLFDIREAAPGSVHLRLEGSCPECGLGTIPVWYGSEI